MADLWRSNGSKNFAKLVMIKQIKMQYRIFLSNFLFIQIFHSKMEIHLDSYCIVILSKKDSMWHLYVERIGVEQRFYGRIWWNFRWTIYIISSKKVQPYILQSFWTSVDKFWKWPRGNFIRAPKKRGSSNWVEKVQSSMVQQKGLICTKFKNPIRN